MSAVPCPAARVISSRSLVGSIAARHGWVHCVFAVGTLYEQPLEPFVSRIHMAMEMGTRPSTPLPRSFHGQRKGCGGRSFLDDRGAVSSPTFALPCVPTRLPVSLDAHPYTNRPLQDLAFNAHGCDTGWAGLRGSAGPNSALSTTMLYPLTASPTLPFTPMVTVHRARLPDPSGSGNASVTSQSRGAARSLSLSQKRAVLLCWN
jgi:hypothetical protein